MKLPVSFIDRMDEFFKRSGISADGFEASFDAEPRKGIRINTLKSPADMFPDIMRSLGEDFDPVPWCSCGFYTKGEGTGNDPYYHAGVYYPQEPSAMLPAEVMGVRPGDRVLDLCAAPGGKACRMGEDLKGEGLLVANEINANRAKALLRNIERMGIAGAVILNETPENLAGRLRGFFDKILVDAPCSGEGMFRRDPNAVKSWERFGPDTCMPMQRDILDAADKMLRPGGELVYSTCTFFEGEDEDMVLSFMDSHPGYEVIAHPEISGVTHASDNDKLPGSMRIWPHLSGGDGHFCVHLKKSENIEGDMSSLDKIPSYKLRRNDNYGFGKSKQCYESFMKDILVDFDMSSRQGDFVMHGNRIHFLNVEERWFNGLKAVKLGEYPGEIKTTSVERIFVPSNSLALSLNFEFIREDSLLSLSREDDRLIRYIKGETLTLSTEETNRLKKSGHIVVAAGRYPLGFGKLSGSQLKNMYPKNWRLM